MTQPQAITPDPHTLHGQALRALEEFRMHDAVRHLRAAVLLAPREAVYWNDLGVVLEALGHPTEALRCYRTALDRENGHREARENYDLLRRQLAMVRALAPQSRMSTMARPAGGVSAVARRRAAAASCT
jgi:protein O-GlcNAc transferase